MIPPEHDMTGMARIMKDPRSDAAFRGGENNWPRALLHPQRAGRVQRLRGWYEGKVWRIGDMGYDTRAQAAQVLRG